MSMNELQTIVRQSFDFRDEEESLICFELVDITGRLCEHIRNRNPERASYELSRIFLSLFRISNKIEASLRRIVLSKYAAGCPYCLSKPCQCIRLVLEPEVRKSVKKRRADGGLMAKPTTLADFFWHVVQIYGASLNLSTVETESFHMMETLGLASNALRSGNLSDLDSAVADIFVRGLTLTKKLEISIETIEKAICDQCLVQKEKISDRTFVDLHSLWKLVQGTDNRQRGRSLEGFAFALFSTVPCFHVKRNVRSDTSEFDLVIGINPEKKGGKYWQRYQPLVFVECKCRKKTSGQDVVSKILGKVTINTSGDGTTLIFVLSTAHFSPQAIQLSRYAFLKKYLIVLITKDDVNRVIEKRTDIDSFLRELVESTCMRLGSPAT